MEPTQSQIDAVVAPLIESAAPQNTLIEAYEQLIADGELERGRLLRVIQRYVDNYAVLVRQRDAWHVKRNFWLTVSILLVLLGAALWVAPLFSGAQ